MTRRHGVIDGFGDIYAGHLHISVTESQATVTRDIPTIVNLHAEAVSHDGGSTWTVTETQRYAIRS